MTRFPNPRPSLGIVASFAIALASLAAPNCSKAAGGPVVQTADGLVQGFRKEGVSEFLGIPFAAPPVGNLRWRPPQPPAKWSAVLQATSFGGTCVQNQAGEFAKPSLTEDCLYLNVFTPNDFVSGSRPVMVWFYGGGLVAGESNDYDGSKLAKRGDTVVVTVNYRVGALGFFAHPALDSEGHDVGNYGFMDEQFALNWVKKNIARFGGDGRNVTIFGQSGGGTAVMANLVSPTAAGLFQRVINESGTHITATPLATAEAQGQAFAASAGCAQNSAAACLRALTPQQIVNLGPPTASYFIIDGKIITQPPYESFKSGQFNRVPIMTGLVADEQAFFLPEISGGPPVPLTVAQFNAYVASFGAQYTSAILAAYPLNSYPSPSLAEIAVAQGSKACIARRFDQLWSQYVPVYAYQFDDETAPSYLPPVSYPTRAYHTSELLYLFPLFHGGQGTPHPLNATQEKLSNKLVTYWTSFANSGNPNNYQSVNRYWTPYSSNLDNVIALIEPKPYMTYGYGSQTYQDNKRNDCALWDNINVFE